MLIHQVQNSIPDVSAFAISSSTSSRPSPEPVNGHLIDEAEMIDLLEGSDAQETIVSQTLNHVLL